MVAQEIHEPHVIVPRSGMQICVTTVQAQTNAPGGLFDAGENPEHRVDVIRGCCGGILETEQYPSARCLFQKRPERLGIRSGVMVGKEVQVHHPRPNLTPELNASSDCLETLTRGGVGGMGSVDAEPDSAGFGDLPQLRPLNV